MYTFSWCLCFVLLSSVLPVLCGRRHPNHHHHHKHAKQEERPNLYLNEFAIKIDGDDVDAQAIASKYGLINLGKVKIITYKLRLKKLTCFVKCSISNSSKSLQQYLLETKHNYTSLQTVLPFG